METIGEQKLWPIADGRRQQPTTCAAVRKGSACTVNSFMDLAEKVAGLQFANRDYVLLYRGQNADFQDGENGSSLKPSLFRPLDGAPPGAAELMQRFARLQEAERSLGQIYARRRLPGFERLKRQQILRWAILQHYEICWTPLLDVTQSLRIAASFALEGAENEAFVMVLGVPHLSGAITASAEAGVQIVRLASVCPPTALRPHIQEGYLLGEYPEMTGFDQKQHYAHYEIDFGRQLVGKFRFDPKSFWKDKAFPRVKHAALYPNVDDPLFHLAEEIRPFQQNLL